MNQNQLNSNLKIIESILNLNLPIYIGELYSKDTDIENTMVSSYSVYDFTNLLIRALKQLQNEMQNGLGPLLPEQFNFQNEYGSGSLNAILSSIKTDLESKNKNNLQGVESQLKVLVYYEIINGFYEKSNLKVDKSDNIDLSSLETQLKMMISHFKKNLDLKKELYENLENKINEIQGLVDQKRNELNQISTNLQTSNQDSKTISDLLNKSTEYSSKINSTFEQMIKMTEDAKIKIDDESKIFNELKLETEKLIANENENLNKLESQVESFDKKLEFVESKKKYFEDRNNYLNELIGREVGASLFETFKQRKQELSSNLGFWKYSVVVASFILLIALIVLFWEIPSNATWEYFVVRSLKTIPLGILLYFTIRQYSKERNFQEEYAFKSACALTIKAYADLIKDAVEKDKLITAGVSTVFTSPIHEKEVKENKNETLDIFKNLSESVKNFSKK